MKLLSRQYEGEADYERMRRFLVRILPLAGTRQYCTIGDLDWWRWTDDPSMLTWIRLWLDAKENVVGFTWSNEDEVDVIVDPAHPDLDEEMYAWAEQHRRREEPDQPTLTAWSYETHTSRNEILRRRGYTPINKAYLLRRRSLTAPLPAPVVPAGYVVRHVRGEVDLEPRVAVHRDAFAPSRMTIAKHRAVMAAATYRPELDLVVAAADGSFAAYCIAWFDEANRYGVFEPVGTHSAHRQRGLGKAVLLEGMRRLHALGAECVGVWSLSDSLPANRLYDSVGLTVDDRCGGWTKALLRA